MITITHSPAEGTRALDVPEGAAAIFTGAGWRLRGAVWSLASSAGRPARATLIQATINRLDSAGFRCTVVGVHPPAPGDAPSSERRLELLHAQLQQRADHASPGTVQGRIDALESRSQLTEVQVYELGFWQGIRTQQIAAGDRLELAKDSVSVSDRVRTAAGWGVVQRPTRRWVAVWFDSGAVRRVPYTEILEHTRH